MSFAACHAGASPQAMPVIKVIAKVKPERPGSARWRLVNDASRTDFHKHIDAKESEQQSGCSTAMASKHALSQQLAHQAEAMGAERARTAISRWRAAARTSTVRHVCTGDQEHESHRDKQHQESATYIPNKLIPQ